MVAKRVGLSEVEGVPVEPVLVMIRPAFIAYVFSGVVTNSVTAFLLGKHFWEYDDTKKASTQMSRRCHE